VKLSFTAFFPAIFWVASLQVHASLDEDLFRKSIILIKDASKKFIKNIESGMREMIFDRKMLY